MVWCDRQRPATASLNSTYPIAPSHHSSRGFFMPWQHLALLDFSSSKLITMPQPNNRIIYTGPNAIRIPVLSDYVDGARTFLNSSIAHIGPISNINILVGANNSGKSRFMRALLKARGYIMFNDEEVLNSYYRFTEILKQLGKELRGSQIQFRIIGFDQIEPRIENFISAEHLDLFKKRFVNQFTIDENYISNYIDNLNKLMELEALVLKEEFPKLIESLKTIRFIAQVSSLDPNYTMYPLHNNYTLTYGFSNIYRASREFLQDLSELSYELEKGLKIEVPPKRIYIPILRAARALLPNTDGGKQMSITERRALTSLFAVTISKSYDILDDGIEINTGLDLYAKISRDRNDSKASRTMFDKFESFISNSFFQGKEFEIVAKYAEPGHEEHLHVSINGAEHEIHFLGDGIQSLITLLYPIFLAEKGSWVFIEEPEVHLHPGMQRLFIETLLNNSVIKDKELIIFLTTHSNHLFDIAVENLHSSSVLAFRKISEEPSKFLVSSTNPGELQILNLLEVSNSSVFMANCAIWVEGPTDRVYLRKYFRRIY
jgi:AAA15 family ATPase/GTPase